MLLGSHSYRLAQVGVFKRPARLRLAIRAMASGQGPSSFILQYAYVPDILEKRDPYREGHLKAIKTALSDQKMVIGGAIADPIDGGLLIFQDATKDEVEAYVKADPYYQGGLIASYTIRPYLVVKQ